MAFDVRSISHNLIVASIDFGTTYSGWAYSFYHDFKKEPTKAYVKQWHAGTGILSTEKCPTVVLIKPDGTTLEGFGYDAENRYKGLIETDEHRDYFYFKKFKMKLYKQLSEKIDRNFMLEDEMGKNLPALDVFTIAIKYLQEDVLNVVKTRMTGDITQSDVHWVLTVPAIWTDQAKQFMREAAEQAGIERYKLSIALEPEAASAYCRHLPMDKAVESAVVSIASLPVGTKYMILDAGGGTIDITVHEVNENNTVKEVIAANGGDWGGTLVDKAFENLVSDLVGSELYRAFKEEQNEDWIDLMRDFEVKKKSVYPDQKGKVMIRFPYSLLRMLEQKTNNYLANYGKDIDIVGDKVKFDACIFKRLFEPSCAEVVRHVRGVLQDCKLGSLSLILMVGGYSESIVLQNTVREAFNTMRVVIPNEASTAVLRGALICGHNPMFITERVLKYTYGIRIRVPFVDGKHPECRRIKTDRGDRCDNVFGKHVERGQIVKVGEIQTKREYGQSFRNQDQVQIFIYASLLQNPEYVDVDCTQIGVLTVDAKSFVNFKVEVSFTFGGTELQVEAIVINTGEKRKVAINLLS